VRAKNIHPSGHTRLPRYVRGHVGTIERLHGCHIFPDSNAAGPSENPQRLYTVRVERRELWGLKHPKLMVSVDAWEPYLEASQGDRHARPINRPDGHRGCPRRACSSHQF